MEQTSFKLLPPTQEHAVRGIKSTSDAQYRMIATVDRKIAELLAKKEEMLKVISIVEAPVKELTGGLTSSEYFAAKEQLKAQEETSTEATEDDEIGVDDNIEEEVEDEDPFAGHPSLPEEAINEFN